MIVCATCGNKRCPHAWWHGNACTGSNEPNQSPREVLDSFSERNRIYELNKALGEARAVAVRERDEARRQLSESQEQITTILKAKATAERVKGDLQHDLCGIVGFIASHYYSVESMGVPLPPRTGNTKHDAAILMNAVVEAAKGKTYLPSSDEVKLVRRAQAAEAKFTQAEDREKGLRERIIFLEHRLGNLLL